MTNRQQIKEIVEAIGITPDRNLTLRGQPWGDAFSNPYLAQPNNKMLFQALQSLIYSVFYTRNTETAANTYPAPGEIEAFMNELSAANASREQFDAGWQIEQVDALGGITAAKGNFKRTLHPGEFVNESGFHQKPGVQSSVRVYARKEHKDSNTGFYYMFGDTIAEEYNEMLVRIYFNLKPEGAKKLVAVLSDQLNKYRLPFSFKCLYHPSLYKRADSAVLYFDKRYSHLLFRLFPTLYEAIKDSVNEKTPMFTRRIAKGVGFAENPFNPEESFGTHTSKMLTQALLHCINNAVPRQHWEGEVISNITKRHGYADIETLYLNAGSAYPYSFPPNSGKQ